MNGTITYVFLAAFCVLVSAPTFANERPGDDSFRVMTWNIWHGGREDGSEVGPKRVIETIEASKADIVAMQETYGSGEKISKALKFQFAPRGTNVSIHSRFPVIEDISVFEEFKCAGALLQLPNNRQIAFYSIWLPYNKEIWKEGTRDTNQPKSMLSACQASCNDLKKIYAQIQTRLSHEKYKHVPVIIAGDFNSMSHLDYSQTSKDQFGVVIDWPTSHVMTDAGFIDSWREQHAKVDRQKERTWTPRFPQQEQDRIDFIYYRGTSIKSTASKMIDKHPIKFPSDHAAVVTQFRWTKTAPKKNENTMKHKGARRTK